MHTVPADTEGEVSSNWSFLDCIWDGSSSSLSNTDTELYWTEGEYLYRLDLLL